MTNITNTNKYEKILKKNVKQNKHKMKLKKERNKNFPSSLIFRYDNDRNFSIWPTVRTSKYFDSKEKKLVFASATTNFMYCFIKNI